MDKTAQYIDALKRDVEERIGGKLYSHGDFTKLANEVFEMTKEMISATTLKRLWGYLRQESPTPQTRTLNVLAAYIGFKDWQDYCACQESKNDYSSEFVKHSAQHCFLMGPGEMIRIAWYPNRTLVLRHEGDGGLFSVVASENSKLEPGMTLHCSTFAEKEPLLLKNVKGGSLTEACDYLCGTIGGIEYELMGK
jgi:hypothetical protein